MRKFPTTPDDLSTQWLSAALGFPVQGFEVTYFGEGGRYHGHGNPSVAAD